MHQQTAYRHFPALDGGMAVSEQLSRQAISLPMHSNLDQATQDHIIEAVIRAAN
jgi:UDP-2-acetamido-2-deoxy-ribo-hexuluronate aminotransferase